MVCDLLPIEKLMGSQDTLLYYTSTEYPLLFYKLPHLQYLQ